MEALVEPELFVVREHQTSDEQARPVELRLKRRSQSVQDAPRRDLDTTRQMAAIGSGSCTSAVRLSGCAQLSPSTFALNFRQLSV